MITAPLQPARRGRTFVIRRRRRRGFTVIEMIVAVVLLGVGIAACVACIGSATRASALGEEYTAVALMAREKLTDLELRGAAPGESQGDFGEERPGFAWRMVAAPGDTPGLLQVRLTVLWGPEQNPRQAEFVTYTRSAGQP